MATASQQFRAKGLREKRGKIKEEIQRIGAKMAAEERAMSSEEKAAFDQLKADFAKVSEDIRVVEADMQAVDAAILASDTPPADAPPDPAAGGGSNSAGRGGVDYRTGKPKRGDGASEEQRAADRALAFQAWARHQHGLGLKREHKAACQRIGMNPRAKHFDFVLKRSQSVGTNANGGYTVKREFSGALEQALEDFSNVRGVCDQFTTDTGANLDYPTEDDTNNTGARVSEEQEVSFADDSFGSVTFYGFKYTSKGVLISFELLNDSAFDLETILGQRIGERIGRIQGQEFTTGTGSSQPQGIVTAASAGLTTASATAWTAVELTRLAFSVDRAYRNDPSCGYMMHDNALAYTLLLVDGQSRPLIRDSYRDGILMPMLNGFPVHTNQFMEPFVTTVPVTAKKHVIFGAMNRFKVRDVKQVRVRRLDERYAEKDQVGFIGFMRSDSRCINSSAIKYLLQA